VAEVAGPAVGLAAAADPVKPKVGHDDKLTLAFVLMIGFYLVVSLALPLAFMLWKSTEVRSFAYPAFEVEVNTGQGFQPLGSLEEAAGRLGLLDPQAQARRGPSLTAAQMFRDGALEGTPVEAVRIRFTGRPSQGSLELLGTAVPEGEWAQAGADELRRLVMRAGTITSFANFTAYFTTPALSRSITNSLTVSLATTFITVLLAFGFAYALQRTQMAFKGVFRTLAMVPILVPSLLAGISLVYLFGNQGLMRGLLFGNTIYGAPGIIVGSVFFTFPHALLIISTALAISRHFRK